MAERSYRSARATAQISRAITGLVGRPVSDEQRLSTLSSAEIVARMGVSRRTAQRWRASGAVPESRHKDLVRAHANFARTRSGRPQVRAAKLAAVLGAAKRVEIRGVQGHPYPGQGGDYTYHYRTIDVRLDKSRADALVQAWRDGGVDRFITQLGHTVPSTWTDRNLGLFWDYDPADDSSAWGFEDVSSIRFL